MLLTAGTSFKAEGGCERLRQSLQADFSHVDGGTTGS